MVTHVQRRLQAEGLGRAEARSRAVAEGRRLVGSPRTTLVAPAPDEIAAALEEQEAFPDPRVGLVDCASFVVMRRLRIRTAFTFDQDFRAAGFDVFP